MNNHSLAPQTPPRRYHARGSRLTPSKTTPYVTPSRTAAPTTTGQRSNRRSYYKASPASSLLRTAPHPSRPSGQRGRGGGGGAGGTWTAGTTPSLYYTPGTSSPPARDTQDDDRFIPSRRRLNMDLCRRALLSDDPKKRSHDSPSTGNSRTHRSSSDETPLQKEFKRRMLSSLCNVPLDRLDEDGEPTALFSFGSMASKRTLQVSSTGLGNGSNGGGASLGPPLVNPFVHDTLRQMKMGDSDFDPAARLSVAKKVLRKVPSAPVRILDAPDIVDDYYLNLISWSKDNILAVALAQAVYLWNATTGDIQHLLTVDQAGTDYITSVCWCPMPGQTKYIAVGTNAAQIHLFDGHALRKVRTLAGHTGRVSALAWNQEWLTSGARDSLIINHDIRQQQRGNSNDAMVNIFKGHEQEVCGLKWNEDGKTLASGGNENFLCLWDAAMSNSSSSYNHFHARRNGELSDHDPRLVLKQHKAAVKALDFCPFHRGLLASGGGTADRTIKFWNSSSGAMLNSIDTGSQVCSIVWSKHQRELCSSHGYSENQLILWKYPTMTKIKELTGHTARVLNMEMSPDGTSVVSAAADETLRFWNIFGNSGSGGAGGNGAPGMGVHRQGRNAALLGDDSFLGAPTIR